MNIFHNFNLSRQSILLISLGIAGIIFFVQMIWRYPISADTFLHLGLGEYIMDHRKIPGHSDISYKTIQPSLEWATRNWLFDVFTYIALRPNIQFGSMSVLLFCVGITLALLRLLLRRDHIPLQIQIPALTLFLILSPTYWRMHPVVLLIPLMLFAHLSYREWRLGKKGIFRLPFIGFFIANLAGGSILVFASLLIVILIFEEFVYPTIASLTQDTSFLPKGSRSELRYAAALSFGATCLNPLGINLYVYGMSAFALMGTNKWYSTLPGILEATNTNAFKNAPSTTLYVIFLIYSLILISLCIIFFIRNFTKTLSASKGSLHLITLLFFGVWFVRYIPLSVSLTLGLASSMLSLSEGQWKSFRRGRITFTPLIIFTTLLTAVTITLAFTPPRHLRFEPPQAQCDMIQNNHLPSNFLSSTEVVGYLYYCMYPEKQQIDLRDEIFDESDTIGLYASFSSVPLEEGDSILEENKINSVLIGKENDYLTAYFNKNPHFSLIYIDYSGLLFVRNNAVSSEFLSQHVLRYFDLTRNLGSDPTQIPEAISELERFSDRNPQNILAAGQLASLYRFSQDYERAEKALQKIPRTDWGFPLHTEHGRLLAAQGKCEEALDAFRFALRDRDERNVSRVVFDLAILYAGCFHDSDTAKKYFTRYLSYPIPEQERQRAFSIARKFIISLEKNQ